MGISRANFAVAETGTIVLISNEGNARLTTTCPRIHIAFMGIEKVLRAPRSARLSEIARPAATGQTLSVYTTLITADNPGEQDGPEEFHLVLLDNGRSRHAGDAVPRKLAVHPLRCVSERLPGVSPDRRPRLRRRLFGTIGSVLTPLYDSVADNPHLPHASSLCGACQSACPVKINIPHMLIGLSCSASPAQTCEPNAPCNSVGTADLCRLA